MRFCIPRPNEKMNMITYKNVDYTALCERSLWKTEGYDYVIVNLGSWLVLGCKIAFSAQMNCQ